MGSRGTFNKETEEKEEGKKVYGILDWALSSFVVNQGLLPKNNGTRHV